MPDDAPDPDRPGRRAPTGAGEPVDDVPVLRRLPVDTDALISIDTSDTTAWCPYDGTADYYALHLEYWPDGYALELMSYREYLQTFRDDDISHEAFAKQVYEALVALLDPTWLRLEVEASPRYGLETTLRHQTAPKPQPLHATAASSGACDSTADAPDGEPEQR